MKAEAKRLKKIPIWIEGYRATGEAGLAQKLGEYVAYDFDQAVQMYMSDHPNSVNLYVPADFWTPEHFNSRPSKYHIWKCSLFDNEADARKAFG